VLEEALEVQEEEVHACRKSNELQMKYLMVVFKKNKKVVERNTIAQENLVSTCISSYE